MTSRTKLLFQRACLVAVGTVLLLGLVAYSEGAVTVYVHEKAADGHRLWLPVPALMVDEGLRFVPEEKLEQASRDIRPWLPAIEVASAELAGCPDGLLVEVKDQTDRVTIVKRGDALVVDVDSETDTVHVSVPVRLVRSLARRLETARGPN